MPPETIAGRYRVEREVGRGGMGSVWLCHDELLGREVAVKQVGRMPGESTTDLARAMREARSSAALNHRNVVAVYDAVEEGDHVWLVMEYVPGRTLSQIVAEDGPLPPERVAVDRRPGRRRPGGRARPRHRAPRRQAGQRPGHRRRPRQDLRLRHRPHPRGRHADPGRAGAGTPAYFSPELARGDAASPASDVWALGATLYAAVEGRGAYPEQANALALLTTIATERPAAPARAGVLAETLGRMMDPDPASRWGMVDAAHSLHRIHEGPPRAAPARSSRRPSRPRQPCRSPVHCRPPLRPRPVRRRFPRRTRSVSPRHRGGAVAGCWPQSCSCCS